MTFSLSRMGIVASMVLVVGGAVAGATALVAVGWMGVEGLHSTLARVTRWDAIALGAARLEANVARLQLREKDFLLAPDGGLADAHAAETDIIRHQLADLLDAVAAFAPQAAGAIGHPDKELQAYSAAFDAMVEARRTMGFTPDAGELGALRAAAHEVEAAAKSLGDDGVMIGLLNLRRAEKDAMLWHDQTKVKAVRTGAAELAARLRDKGTGVADTAAKAVEAYLAAFGSWNAAEAAVDDRRNETRLRGENLKSAFAQMAVIATSERGRVAAEAEAVAARTVILFLVTGAVIVLLVSAVGLLVGRTLARSVRATAAVAGAIAAGERAIDIPFADAANEVGVLSGALRTLRDGLAAAEAEREGRSREDEARSRRLAARNALSERFVAEVDAMVSDLIGASTDMSTSAETLSATAEETTRQVQTVGGAAQTASATVRAVAAAAEELSVSVNEISERVETSAAVAEGAFAGAARSAQAVRALSEAAGSIGAVVDMIRGIAEQTNLLALNATIEAARAGEAGRGFAVVAGEVKDLAGQTAKATSEIAAKIQEIQSATAGTVVAIEGIVATLGEVKSISGAIAAAVTEQGAATAEIADNCQRAAAGTATVTGTMAGVGDAAGTTGAAAARLSGLSEDLRVRAEALRSTVDRFIADLKAA